MDSLCLRDTQLEKLLHVNSRHTPSERKATLAYGWSACSLPLTMASHEHLPAAGGSRLTAPTSALADARSIIGQHGVSLATVNATLNTRTSLIRPSGRGVYLRELDDPANLLQVSSFGKPHTLSPATVDDL